MSQLKIDIAPYMLCSGKENAAIENDRMPVRAQRERERRRLGTAHVTNTAKACDESTKSSSERASQNHEPFMGRCWYL